MRRLRAGLLWLVRRIKEKEMKIIKQTNQEMPKVFEANRTQVNINIRQEALIIDGVSINGYSYDTVIEDANSWMYDDDALLQRAINFEANELLRSTDWYVTRFAETGVAIPQEILDMRAAARAKL